MLPETSHAYAAGMLDGEGCLGITRVTKSGRVYHRADVRIANTDVRVMAWLKENYGGWIQGHGFSKLGTKECFQWHTSGKAMVAFLESVRPYMIIKAEQADIVLAFRKTIRKVTGRKRSGQGKDSGWESLDPVTPEIAQDREKFRLKIVGLNE